MDKARRSGLWDVGVLLSAGVLVACYCLLVSRDRIFWSDELFGWMLVSDPSWKHMFRAWQLGADGGGIGFYALGRLWLGVFGRSALAFRAFSAAGVFAGFAGMWFALRRFYRPEIVTAALGVTWFGSRTILWQVIQTRFYGLLLGATAWSLWAGLRSARETDEGKPQAAFTPIFAFVAHLALVSAHPFGLVFSGCLLAGAALDDAGVRRRRPVFYLAGMLPWTILLFSRTAMRNSARVGEPWFWTTRPHLKDLVMTYIPGLLPSVHRFVSLLFVAVAITLLRKGSRDRLWAGLTARRSALLAALPLVSAPVLFWLASQRGTSYFVDRYFLPSLLGVAILLAELLTGLFPHEFSWRRPAPMLGAVVGGCLLCVAVGRGCMWQFAKTVDWPPRDWTGALAAKLPRDEPVLFPKTDIFDVMAFYRNPAGPQFLFPLDWDLAISPESPRWLVSAEREMENWRAAGYYSAQIRDSAVLLGSLPRFAVVTSEDTPWFGRRVAGEPGWQVRKLGEYRDGPWSNTIWQVTRVP